MTVSAAPGIFDVFNARQLTPEQVAATFVPPPAFDQLVKPTHALIVGPRGSGKTTLLKMLLPHALEAWLLDDAAKYRALVDYTGVFVATDINWNEQVNGLGDGRLDIESHRQFAKAAFTTEILQSVIDSMIFRARPTVPSGRIAHRRVTLSSRDEHVLAKELISSWHLERTIPTLEGVQFSLTRRLSNIRVMASQEGMRKETDRLERLAEIAFLHLDFVASAGVAVKIFNELTGDHDGRWALLFDELELAPPWIRKVLIRCLRSVNAYFLFKISLSPYSVDLNKEMEGPEGAGAKQDFQPIRLWYPNKEQGYPFCRALLASPRSSELVESFFER